ncbi:transcription repressor OFP13-like [Quillaja saponaria]|uniref:Transcription repressor n=1 Tax=Quillaja saponaria TaxID=32244 RepID=A0AAD7VHM3_QUISA|nr:transcription repressor OFP13-like [Quillaja saponaria]
MGKKKMKLPFLLKIIEGRSSWPWPSCHQPRTLSFRTNNDIFKTINSAYLDAAIAELETAESFLNNFESPSFSTASEESRGEAGDPIETVIRGLRSDRLFFEPGETSSILESKAEEFPFKESVVLSMESQDPYVDFRKSMEEMVEAHGVNDWEGLEELLCWYLRVNGKNNHGYIVGAFVDLLVGLSIASSCSPSSHSPSSPLSFYTSSTSSSSLSTPSVSCLEVHTPSSSSVFECKEDNIKHKDDASS